VVYSRFEIEKYLKLSFFKIVLILLGALHFNINLSNSLPISEKNKKDI
jgi:hypothetical protein